MSRTDFPKQISLSAAATTPQNHVTRTRKTDKLRKVVPIRRNPPVVPNPLRDWKKDASGDRDDAA